jgi:hypothetical protein
MVTMTPFLLAALLLSSAPRPFQPLAHLAPPVSTETEGVATVTAPAWPEDGYFVDDCLACNSRNDPMYPVWTRFEVNQAYAQVPPWVPPSVPTLILDGMPLHTWGLSL